MGLRYPIALRLHSTLHSARRDAHFSLRQAECVHTFAHVLLVVEGVRLTHRGIQTQARDSIQ